MKSLLNFLSGGYGGAIKAFLLIGAIIATLGYTYRAGIKHERKAWVDKQLVETLHQQAADIAARDAALESQRLSAKASAANNARREAETNQLKAAIETLKTLPNSCPADAATSQLLNDYAKGKFTSTTNTASPR